MKVSSSLGVTGTPGTGKSSVSTALASLLAVRLVEINDLAIGRSHAGKGGERVVDTKALRAGLDRSALAGAVVSGHLLADLLRPSDVVFVAVLRCDPGVLKGRLAVRGYPAGKVLDNVEAELIGLVLDSAVRRFGAAKVHEYDTTRASASYTAKRILRDYRAGRPQSPRWVDWTLAYDSSTKLTSLLSRPKTEPAST